MTGILGNFQPFTKNILQLRSIAVQAAKKTSSASLPVGFRKVSPFGCYVKEKFTKTEGEPASVTMARLSTEWKSLSDDIKKKYEEMSEQTLKERTAKFAALSVEEQQKLCEESKKNFELRKMKKERKAKKQERPPKPMSGYNLFMKEKLSRPRKEDEGQKDLLLKAVEEWKKLSEVDKEKYNACARAELQSSERTTTNADKQ